MLTAIGYGLLSTLTPHTSAGEWIGYQILAGAGRGLGLQIPIIAVQKTLLPPQIPTAMSLVMFSQMFGGSLFLSFADTTFTNRLRSLLVIEAPQVSADTVVDAGVYSLRSAVPEQYLGSVLRAYSQSTDSVFYLCVGLAVTSFFLAWGMGWIDIRDGNKKHEQTADNTRSEAA